MKGLFSVLIFVSVFGCLLVSAKSSPEPVYSTQGIEIDSAVANSKPSIEKKNKLETMFSDKVKGEQE